MLYLNSPNYKLDQTNTRSAIKNSSLLTISESRRIDTSNIMIDQLRGKIEHKDYEIIRQYYRLEDWKACITAAKTTLREYPEPLQRRDVLHDINSITSGGRQH